MLSAIKKKRKNTVNCKWYLGFNDRGMGHGDYGIITKKGDLVIPTIDPVIALHIINAHNVTVRKR